MSAHLSRGGSVAPLQFLLALALTICRSRMDRRPGHQQAESHQYRGSCLDPQCCGLNRKARKSFRRWCYESCRGYVVRLEKANVSKSML